MPTVILLDVSLSMSRFVDPTENEMRLIDLASTFILNFIDHLSLYCNQEYTSLVVFSSLYEVLVKFTRDYESLRKACTDFQTYDKTVFETTFQGLESVVTEEWGKTVPINVVLITDGLCGIGDGSLKESLKTVDSRKFDNKFPFPFSFPCHLSIVCLALEKELLKENRQCLEQLISMNYDKGELLIPDNLSDISVTQCFGRLMNLHYKRFETTLKCGHFQSHVMLSPAPGFQNTYCNILNFYRHHEDEVDILKLKFGCEINIIGFLELQDFGNPPFISRHLVLPLNSEQNKTASSKHKHKDGSGQIPSFCVLLHGSLKTEKMGAVVQLRDDWYGMLYSWSDQKKKSNLMMSTFEPGNPFPWVGDMRYLGPALELPINPYCFDSKENAEETPFLVIPDVKHSYQTQSNAVWIKSSGLQSDIQKLLRYARKLPERQSAFFKEVNKLRRAGMIYGFFDLLNALADALENECTHMKTEVVVQLRHVAEGLRKAPSRDINTNIVAINTFRKKSADSS